MSTRDTINDLIRERNALRQKLWADDTFAHRWLCHPERDCKDGCETTPMSNRLRLYDTELEQI